MWKTVQGGQKIKRKKTEIVEISKNRWQLLKRNNKKPKVKVIEFKKEIGKRIR